MIHWQGNRKVRETRKGDIVCDGYDQANAFLALDQLKLERAHAERVYEEAVKTYRDAASDPWGGLSIDLERAGQHAATLSYAIKVLEEDHLDEREDDD